MAEEVVGIGAVGIGGGIHTLGCIGGGADDDDDDMGAVDGGAAA